MSETTRKFGNYCKDCKVNSRNGDVNSAQGFNKGRHLSVDKCTILFLSLTSSNTKLLTDKIFNFKRSVRC